MLAMRKLLRAVSVASAAFAVILLTPMLSHADVVLFDFGTGNVQGGWAEVTNDGFGFNGAVGVSVYPVGDGVILDARDRGTGNGGGAESQMWRDFLFANGSNVVADGLDITISGLAANTTYPVKIWAFDDSSDGGRSGDWNGATLTFPSSPDPTTLDDYMVETTMVADAFGTATIEGRVTAGFTGSHNVFINGMEIGDPIQSGVYTWNSFTPEGTWGSANWTKDPAILISDYPTLTPPNKSIGVIIDGPSAHVRVEADHSATSLSMSQGKLTIETGNTLTITEAATATEIAMQSGSNLAVGSGAIDLLTTSGPTTLEVTSGTLSVASLTNSSPDLLTKVGDGTLSVSVVDLAAATTAIDLGSGTLQLISASITHVVPFELSNSAWDLAGIPAYSTLDEVALNGLLGIGPVGDINTPPGLRGALYSGTLSPTIFPIEFLRELRYESGEFDAEFPGWGLDDYYAALWDGWITISEDTAGTFAFGTRSDEGSAIWIEVGNAWQLVVDNSGLHGERTRVGEIALPEGMHRIAIAMYEWEGGDAIEARVGVGEGLDWNSLATINPESSDITSYLPINNPNLNLRVTGDSTLEPVSTAAVHLPVVTLAEGVLTTRNPEGGSITLAGTKIAAGAKTVGVNPEVPTDFGTIDGSLTTEPFVFTKGGPSRMTLSTDTMTGMENATLDVSAGTLVLLPPNPWAGARSVQLSGGTLRVEATPGTLGYWSFDDAAEPARDDSGHALDGTVNGEPTWTAAGRQNGALTLSQLTDDYVTIGDGVNVANGSFSVAIWAKRDMIGEEDWLIGQNPDVAASTALAFGYRASDQFAFAFWTDDMDWPDPAPDTEWHHWAGTYDATENMRRLYKDGVEVDARPTAKGPYRGSGDFWLGRMPRVDRNWDGLVDEAYVTNYALSPEEIGVLQSDRLGLQQAQLLDMSGIEVTVAAPSTLEVADVGDVLMAGPLTMKDGAVLTVQGSPVIFNRREAADPADTIIDPTASAIGFNTLTPVSLGAIDGGYAEVTITKTGPEDLVVAGVGTRLGTTMFDVQDGRLIGLGGESFGGATLQISDAELVLGAVFGGASPVAFGNTIVVPNTGTLTAGKGDQPTAADGPMTIQVPGLTVDGSLALRSTDGYTLELTSELTGTGKVTIGEGNVSLAAGGNIPQMVVSGGVVDTGTSSVQIAETLLLGETEVIATAPDSFAVRGADLLAAADVLLSGGIVHVTSTNVPTGGASLKIDFNSISQDGGPHNQDGFEPYNAGHEVAADFIAQPFTAFGGTVSVTPAWPNTTEPSVMQMIDRGSGNDANWDNAAGDIDLVTDWLGTDTRTAQNGNGNWDGTTGTPTYMTLALSGLDVGSYNWTSYHHDTENVHGFFRVELSLDGGASFTQLDDGYFSDSTSGGNENPASTTAGFPGPQVGPDANTLLSTYSTAFSADGVNDVVFRFAPYANTAVHRQLFGINGFVLTQQAQVVVNDPGVNFVASLDTTLALPSGTTATLGSLRIEPDVTLTVESPAASFQDIAAEGNATLIVDPNGDLTIRGTLLPDIAAATLNVTASSITFAGGSTYAATIAADGHDLLDASGVSVIIDGEDSALELQIDGKRRFLAGDYDLIVAGGEENLSGMFAEVRGLGDYFDGVSVVDGTTLRVSVSHNLHPGDADLNRTTDVRDFNVWNTNKFTSGTDWASGDFDGNGVTDVRDFNVWNTSKFTSVAGGTPPSGGAVPEPGSLVLLACGLFGILVWRRKRNAGV